MILIVSGLIDLRLKRIQYGRSFVKPVKLILFQFEGETVSAQAGDTVAAALLAHGVEFFRVTPISGSPRAPFCMMGACFDCLVEIDNVPNRQACMITVSEGMQVRRMRGARG